MHQPSNCNHGDCDVTKQRLTFPNSVANLSEKN